MSPQGNGVVRWLVYGGLGYSSVPCDYEGYSGIVLGCLGM